VDINKIRKALCYFGNLSLVLKLRLIKLFCCSLYCSVLWDLDHSCIDALYCTWRKGLRRVWNIPYQTHCNILPLLSNVLPIYDEICELTVNFNLSCLNSNCVLVN